MAGRPTSLTPEVHKAIIDAVRAGNFLSTAAAASGVHRNTVYGWLARADAEDADELYVTFAREYLKADAENEMARVEAILSAKPGIPQVSGPDVWTNHAWYLERRYPAKYSGKVRATVEEIVEGMMRKLAAVLDADNLEKVRDATRPDPGPGSATEARH